MESEVIDWLLQGDPAVRWQVLRDLTDAPEREWRAERQRALGEGWMAELLAHQRPDGTWPPGRWTDWVWSYLLLVALGLPEEHPAGRLPIERQMGRFMPEGNPVDGPALLKRVDLCHLGFWFGLGSHLVPDDPRLVPLGEAVMSAALADGGWNCQVRNYPERTHSSFNTTLNVLENLRLGLPRGTIDQAAFAAVETGAVAFLLRHRLFRSHRTGAVADPRFLQLTYPWHWHYTALRGLDYLRQTTAIGDERATDAIEWLIDRRRPNGRWPLQSRIPGTLLVEMEKPGGESRLNTLRALRVLRQRGQQGRPDAEQKDAPSGRADGA